MHVAVRSRLLVSGESDVLLHCLINECLSEGLLGSCKARHRWGVKVLTVLRPESFWKSLLLHFKSRSEAKDSLTNS